MTSGQERTIEVIQELIDANRGVCSAMEQANAILEQGKERVAAGEHLADIVRVLPASTQRHITQDAFDRSTAARHRLRLLVMEACMADGLNPREIAEIWGISRQRADRFVQEIKRNGPDGAVPAI
jgi:hypothetical protein